MEAPQETIKYDRAARRKSVRYGNEKGVRVYIPAAELRAAGIDPNGPEPEYLLRGYQRSASGCTVMVSLYRADLAEGMGRT